MGKPPEEITIPQEKSVYVDKIYVWVDLALVDSLFMMKEMDNEEITEEIMASENVLKEVGTEEHSITVGYDLVTKIVTVNITTEHIN